MNKTHTLKLYPDQDVTSPRENDNLGTLACWHRRYTLGDEQPREQPVDYQEALPENSLVVPVYMIDHSGIALSTRDFGDPWDSGQVGIYHVPATKIVEEYGEDTPETRQRALEVINAEIEEYSDYVQGNCWGFEILNAEGEFVDGCGGFIGSNVIDNGMVEHLDDDGLDLLEAAAGAAGARCPSQELADYRQRRIDARAKRAPSP